MPLKQKEINKKLKEINALSGLINYTFRFTGMLEGLSVIQLHTLCSECIQNHWLEEYYQMGSEPSLVSRSLA